MDVSIFSEWLNKNTKLSLSSINHYANGLSVISKEMLKKEIIKKPLDEMDKYEYAIAIFNIFMNTDFIKKDSVGKRMYSNALKHYQSFIKDTQSEIKVNTITAEITDNPKLTETEKLIIINARVGQGIFREGLLQKYNRKCIISNISDERLLIASHVKPWAVSNNSERISSENGLLLNALYDRMFDLGLISFTENGELLISKDMNEENISLIQLRRNSKYELYFSKDLLKNMEYHRDKIFLK